MRFDKLTGRRAKILGEDSSSKYAVIAPLVGESFDQLLFEVRSPRLNRQPGEICFPGGRLEAGETPERAALRETSEELLISAESIRLIAPLDIMVNSDSTMIYPYLAELDNYHYTYGEDEVECVFSVPFSFFLDNEPIIYYNSVTVATESPKEVMKLLGTDNYQWRGARYPELFYLWQDYLIWGMTAKFVNNLVSLHKELYGK